MTESTAKIAPGQLIREYSRHCHDIVLCGRMLHKRNYISGTDGNISIRLSADHILITPSGISKRSMRSDDMVVVDMSGHRVEGRRDASSEIGMHLTIYQMRPDVHAVVHAHPCVATGFAAAGMGLTEPVCSELVLTLGRVPLAPYAQPGTAELSDTLRPFIPDHDAILMESHGVVAYGHDLEKAYLKMEAVEHCSRIMLVATFLNAGKSLSQRDVNQLVSVRSQAGSAPLATALFAHSAPSKF